MRFLAHACGCLLVLALAACEQNGLAPVTGTVSVDGQLLEDGTIDFLAADGSTPTAAQVVSKGAYSVEVMPGMKKVVIRGYRVVGQEHASRLDPNSPMIDKKEQFLPPMCSDAQQTTLTAEIPAGGKQGLDFELKSAEIP